MASSENPIEHDFVDGVDFVDKFPPSPRCPENYHRTLTEKSTRTDIKGERAASLVRGDLAARSR